MVTNLCHTCGEEFIYDLPEILHWKPVNCPACRELEDAERASREQHEIHRQRRDEWRAMCPTIYRQTDRARLPKAATDKVMAWKYGPKGLVLHGKTGRGKTRAAFLLMERLHMEGRSVAVFHGNAFGHQCSERFGAFEGEAWIDGLACKDVVFFDDLGKFKLTERVEAELFGLVEMRVAWRRPIIATLNLGGDSLAGKLTGDRGEPMVRRLREFCEPVAF